MGRQSTVTVILIVALSLGHLWSIPRILVSRRSGRGYPLHGMTA
ncbi:hypothetical protein HMPREF9153_0107 [Cutibacterium avidum ATCC 25577]|uniref:Uncharacterized protein n=1 Tax=Cutibacterium avidum ATCC 25577 TaxID=997355 RepID=G4CUA1_9ACTN|nr:hypothetical protein HMPREF9153_0107 [Cutibacterium avidum ATCC 25577]